MLLPLSCLLAQQFTLNLLTCSSVIIQVPACHHLNMRNSTCRPKSDSLVKWFVLDVLWDRGYQMCGFAGGLVCLLVLPLRDGEGSPVNPTNFSV